MERFLICLLLSIPLSHSVEVTSSSPSTADPALEPRAENDPAAGEEPPEGYYAFVESPNATPPRVRPPPYRQVSAECPEAAATKAHVTANNLCGDLNRGSIPRNPMGQSPGGEPYPFELIRNHTLRFLSKTLPVLRADDTLPRVAHLTHYTQTSDVHDSIQDNHLDSRMKRSAATDLPMEHRAMQEEPRESKKFCDGGGVFCMLYRAINGDDSKAVERREDPGPQPHPHGQHPTHPRYEGPPTPCPARVEYATPVFARNYQGVWRYVVQIPYEGYFTQTVEVTRCMQSRCHYLEGGCLSSPRWVSLLVAEMHYPQEYQGTQYLTRRSDDQFTQAHENTQTVDRTDFGQFQNGENNAQRRADNFKYQGEGFTSGNVDAERSQFVQRNGQFDQSDQIQNHNMQRSQSENQNQQRKLSDTQNVQKRTGNPNADTPNNENVNSNAQRIQNQNQRNVHERNTQRASEDNHKQKREAEKAKEAVESIHREKRGIEEVQYRSDATEAAAATAAADKPPHCDGHDELGCYQVRLYYDWFLVPGSCKCWRPDYFARYVRRRQTSPDL